MADGPTRAHDGTQKNPRLSMANRNERKVNDRENVENRLRAFQPAASRTRQIGQARRVIIFAQIITNLVLPGTVIRVSMLLVKVRVNKEDHN
jgi:hypothetical protein